MVSDFMAPAVAVERHGRIYTVRAPTVRAVLTFLVLYAREVEAVRTAGMPSDPFVLLPLFTDARCRDVLRLVCDADEAALSDPKTVEALARALLSATDLARVLEFFAPSPSGGTGPSKLDPWSVSLVTIGQSFGVAPHTIMEWPFTAYLETIEILNAQAKGQDKPAPPWVPATKLTAEQAGEAARG